MANHFGNLFWRKAYTLYLPAPDKQMGTDASRYVQMHAGNRRNPEERPFRKQLDVWAMSIAVAAANGLKPLEGPPSRWGKKFVDTRSVEIGEDLGGFLAVLAVAHYGPESEDALDPVKIIELGNRLAGAGCPVLLRALSDPSANLYPMAKLLDFVRALSGDIASQTNGAAGAVRRSHPPVASTSAEEASRMAAGA